jgi:hypothetical protein
VSRATTFVITILLVLTSCDSSEAAKQDEQMTLTSSSVTLADELVAMSVDGRCVTLSEVETGEETLATCTPSEFDPLFVWGEDRSGTVIALYRFPSEAMISQVEPDSVHSDFDADTGWLKVEYRDVSPVVSFTQRGNGFTCSIEFSLIECDQV